MAWLHSHEPGKDGAVLGESRYALIEQLSDEPDYQYPEPGDLEYLIGYISDIGYCRPAGDGVAVIEWTEIDAWVRMTSNRLTPFEAEALHRLSCEYVGQYAKANGRHCPMPAHEMTRDRREAVADKAREFIAMLRRPEHD